MIKYLFIVITLLLVGCNKKNIEKKLSFSEYYQSKDSMLLSINGDDINNDEIFLNYFLNQTKSNFINSTSKNIDKKVLFEINGELKFPVHTDNTSNSEFFTLTPNFEEDKLKSIALYVRGSVFDNFGNRNPQSHYFYYYSLLSEKYGKAYLEYSDENTREAFWVEENVVISIREEQILKTSTFTPESEFIGLAISYSELKKEKELAKKSIEYLKNIESDREAFINNMNDSLYQTKINNEAF